MNFVGHAVVAGRARAAAPFVFGAMVPDLRRFAMGEELAVDDEPTVHDGVAAHHRTDAAFHDDPRFKAWMAELVASMPEANRGARAAAHVAVELAIDGLLLDAGATDDYDRALAWAGTATVGRWRDVVHRMQAGTVVDAYASASGIADRVVSVMERRPRLRPIAPDRGHLAVAVDAVLPSIAPALPALVDDLVRQT